MTNFEKKMNWAMDTIEKFDLENSERFHFIEKGDCKIIGLDEKRMKAVGAKCDCKVDNYRLEIGVAICLYKLMNLELPDCVCKKNDKKRRKKVMLKKLGEGEYFYFQNKKWEMSIPSGLNHDYFMDEKGKISELCWVIDENNDDFCMKATIKVEVEID